MIQVGSMALSVRGAATAFVAREFPWNRTCSGGSWHRKYTSVVLSNVYPDVSASAACVRTNSIVQGLARLPREKRECDSNGEKKSDAAATKNRVYYATSADVFKEKGSEHPFGSDGLDLSMGKQNAAGRIRMIHLPPNRSDLAEKHFWMGTESLEISDNKCTSKADKRGYDDENIKVRQVDLVIFDRFYVEEAHSFRFRQAFPNAALVLDMQDMHSLRWGRQAIVEAWDKEQQKQQNLQAQQNLQVRNDWDPLGCLPRVLEYMPTVVEGTKESDRFIRELTSIHRSDLVLVCSPQELDWLHSVYGVPKEKLCLASFFVEETNGNDGRKPLPPSDALPPRFVFCGGFKHAPNADAVRILIDCVWPRLRLELPDASLHIYGAFCPDNLLAHNKNKNQRIFVHGYEPDLATIFGQDGSILLAPLRFGAGIKGKIIDAWTFGMPVVTTPIGSEGMTRLIARDDCKDQKTNLSFGGSVASNLDSFCEKTIDLAKNPEAFRQAQTRGKALLKELFSASKNWEHVQQRLLEVMDIDLLSKQRKGDYTQAMLCHQSLRSTEYFSRWVELKERAAMDNHERNTASPETKEP